MSLVWVQTTWDPAMIGHQHSGSLAKLSVEFSPLLQTTTHFSVGSRVLKPNEAF